jgi:6-phosphogluconolactonase
LSADTATGDTRWIGVADDTALQQAAYQRILGASAGAIERHGRFLIVLAGGSTPRDIYRMLCGADTDWSRWHAYFGDERCGPAKDAERNSWMAAETWLHHVPIPAAQVHPIPVELGARAAALAYADMLRGVGEFDLVLLGLGEDGHTASLFPGRDWGMSPGVTDVLAVLDAPKKPSHRVSLSAARLSRTREALFMISGESKRDAGRQWRMGADIPARAIRPEAGVDVLVESTLLI